MFISIGLKLPSLLGDKSSSDYHDVKLGSQIDMFRRKIKCIFFLERNKIRKYFKNKKKYKKKYFFKIQYRYKPKFPNSKFLQKKPRRKLIFFYRKQLRKITLKLKLNCRFFSQKLRILHLAKRKIFSINFFRRRLRRYRFKRTRCYGYIQFKRSLNNLFISIHNRKSKLLYSSSLCALSEKSRDRFSGSNMRLIGEKLVPILHKFRLFRIEIHPYCRLHKGLRNLLWTLQSKHIKIFRIVDLIRTPHGHMTLPSRRRIKRRG
jgi:hypothetical protein